jgi:hypothetical protein
MKTLSMLMLSLCTQWCCVREVSSNSQNAEEPPRFHRGTLHRLGTSLSQSASDSNAINGKLDGLLHSHGPAIWGENADRGRLLIAAGTSNTKYPKNLLFNIPTDREM